MRRACLMLVSLVCLTLQTFSQTFQNVATSVGIDILSSTYQWGTGLSFFDVDEDGWDDLTFAMSGSSTRFYRNLQGNGFQLTAVFFNADEAKSCLWFDMDEDGDNDLLVTRMLSPLQLFRNDGDWIFTDVSGQIEYNFLANSYTWGASVGDPNRDGFLDLFICNYGILGAPNLYLINQGNGHFVEELNTPLTSFSGMTFQSTFVDLNEDGWQDVYAVNDHYQGNEYYVMDPAAGQFVGDGESLGLNVQTDAMNTAWTDYDRDGDLDLYITNIHFGNHLMRNDGEAGFVNVGVEAGVGVDEWCWGALWIDSENTGFDDLFVAVKNLDGGVWNSRFYNNKENGTFIEVQMPESGLAKNAFSAAKGDFNNDGNVDLVVSPEVNRKMSLLMNTSENAHRYVKLRFRGRFSSRNAVGTRYEVFHGGVSQKGQVFFGDSYLTQNTQNIHFGIGDDEQVDSVKVHWLSGLSETFYNLSANQLHLITEGESLPLEVVFSKPFICDGADTVSASFDSHFPRLIWDVQGSVIESAQVALTSMGDYLLHFGAPYGHLEEFHFGLQSFEFSEPQVQSQNVTCFGLENGSYAIDYADAFQQSFHFEQANLAAGNYTVEIPYGMGCVRTFPIQITMPDSMQVSVITTPALCFGESSGFAEVQCTGGTLPHTLVANPNSMGLTNLSAGEYTHTVFDANQCETVFSFVIDQPTPLVWDLNLPSSICQNETVEFSPDINGGSAGYSWNGISPGESIGPGDYEIAVFDAHSCVLDTFVNIESLAVPNIQFDFVNSNLGFGCVEANTLDSSILNFMWEDGSVDSVFCTDQSDVYQVTATNNSGCSALFDVQIIIDDVAEEDVSSAWKSVSQGFEYIGAESLQNVRLYNSVGQLVFQASIVSNGYTISIDEQGMYILNCDKIRGYKLVHFHP